MDIKMPRCSYGCSDGCVERCTYARLDGYTASHPDARAYDHPADSLDGMTDGLPAHEETGRAEKGFQVSAKRVAFGSRKGGAGKTSCVLGIAEVLGMQKQRVLVIDLDSQANATQAFGVEGEFNAFDVLYSGDQGVLSQAVIDTPWPGVSLVPASEDLARIDVEQMMAPEMRLRNAAAGDPALDEYDYILVDCPPNLGKVTINALAYADYAVPVTEPTAFSIRGASAYIDLVTQVKAMLNPGLKLAGVMINAVDNHTSEHAFQVQDIRNAYGDDVFQNVIQWRTGIQDSQSANVPLHKVGSRSAKNAFDAFVSLTQEFTRKVG